MLEELKDIKEFPGYRVSNFGYIIDADGNKLKEYHKKDDSGVAKYLAVLMFDEKHTLIERLIKRIVAQYFIDGFSPNKVVINIDGNYLNNKVDNLEVLKRSEYNKRCNTIKDKENHIRYLNKYRVVYRPEHFHHNLGKDYEGWVYEHRYVMECYLGRSLKKNEIVHHKDGDIYNNDISNLEVLSRSEHTHRHMEDRGYGKDNFCVDCGKKISYGAKRCKLCNDEYTRFTKTGHYVKPDPYDLYQEVLKSNMTKVGESYGVSDKTIASWLGEYYIEIKRKIHKSDK